MLYVKNFLAKSVCKMMMVFAFIVISCLSVFAKSVVYIFVKPSWVPVPIMINNQEVFKMEGHLGRHYYSACKRKCVLQSEGKIIFSVDFKVANPAFPNQSLRLAKEIQLNLSEGSVHYIQLSYKGVNNMQFKEISEKESRKLLKKKSCVLLPDYIEK